VGRPSTYTPEVADEIVRRLSNGEPLAIICRGEGMPCDDTVRNWAKTDEQLSRAIAHAREVGHDVIAWRARMTLRGFGPEQGGESTGDVQRDKAIADYDLKLLAKWDPKRWGDKTALVGGDPANGDNPIQTEQRTVFILPSNER
jgi:hypothetical protein